MYYQAHLKTIAFVRKRTQFLWENLFFVLNKTSKSNGWIIAPVSMRFHPVLKLTPPPPSTLPSPPPLPLPSPSVLPLPSF